MSTLLNGSIHVGYTLTDFHTAFQQKYTVLQNLAHPYSSLIPISQGRWLCLLSEGLPFDNCGPSNTTVYISVRCTLQGEVQDLLPMMRPRANYAFVQVRIDSCRKLYRRPRNDWTTFLRAVFYGTFPGDWFSVNTALCRPLAPNLSTRTCSTQACRSLKSAGPLPTQVPL